MVGHRTKSNAINTWHFSGGELGLASFIIWKKYFDESLKGRRLGRGGGGSSVGRVRAPKRKSRDCSAWGVCCAENRVFVQGGRRDGERRKQRKEEASLQRDGGLHCVGQNAWRKTPGPQVDFKNRVGNTTRWCAQDGLQGRSSPWLSHIIKVCHFHFVWSGFLLFRGAKVRMVWGHLKGPRVEQR